MIQQANPTVGDTVTIVRHVMAPVGAVLEARAPADSSIATLVAPPVLTRDGDSVRVAYTVAVWSAGHNDIAFPGIVVLDQRGRVDTLADMHVAIDVNSVLPAARAPASIAPHPARPWLVREDASLLPFFVLVPLALIVVAGLQWWWRRRPPAPPVALPEAPTAGLSDERLAAWLAAGESRLALEHLDAGLRGVPGCDDWRVRVARARFAQGDDATVVALVREGARLAAQQLAAPERAASP